MRLLQTKERTMTNNQEPNPLDAPAITRLCDYVSDLSRQLDAAHQTIRAIDQERRAEAERHRKEVDAEILHLRGVIGDLKVQLHHERSEREAAQRTIARLGGGLDEFEWPVCANDSCVNEVKGRRKNARYCSPQCKNAAGVRRHRSSNGGGER